MIRRERAVPVHVIPLPPLPYRTRPPQVLLGVGAVLLVTAAAVLASTYGGAVAQPVLLVLTASTAALSLRASAARLRSSAETLAGCAAGLGLAGSAGSGPFLDGEPVSALVLASAFLALHVVAPGIATWPLASWGAVQLAVLRVLDGLSPTVSTVAYLLVALLGLGIALFGRRLVARVALVSTAPWWVVGVLGGSSIAWTGGPGARWPAAVLVVTAGTALLPARLRRQLEPLLGPKKLAPLLAGLISGSAVTGALLPLGTPVLVTAAYAGVLLSTTAATVLTNWRRGLFLPMALAAGTTMTVLCAGRLATTQEWDALSLLLLLTAVPTVLVALRRPEDRPVAVPVAIWCLAGAALLAVPAHLLAAASASVLLTVVYVGAMALGSAVRADVRRPTARAAALTAVAAVVLPAVTGERPVLAVVLAVQGLATLGWAHRTGRVTDADVTGADRGDPVAEEVSAGWKLGAAQLAAAGWTTAALAELRALEAWSLPLAAGLLIAAGPQLLRGRSWPAWGPGLLVAAVPSTLLAVTDPSGPRPVPVLLVAVTVLLAASRAGVLAPLVIGAGTAVVLVLGLAVPALPWPLGAALIVGITLLAWGTLRERYPVAGFRLSLADLR
jgi:hypothetical protein